MYEGPSNAFLLVSYLRQLLQFYVVSIFRTCTCSSQELFSAGGRCIFLISYIFHQVLGISRVVPKNFAPMECCVSVVGRFFTQQLRATPQSTEDLTMLTTCLCILWLSAYPSTQLLSFPFKLIVSSNSLDFPFRFGLKVTQHLFSQGIHHQKVLQMRRIVRLQFVPHVFKLCGKPCYAYTRICKCSNRTFFEFM